MSKRALVVGINNFIEPSYRLRGCINDTVAMQGLLKTYFGFQSEDICVRHDEDASAQGIREGLSWLLSDYDGDGSDVRLFHFSSHGTYVDDQNQDDPDCTDEVIVPYDHDWDDPFRDDYLWEMYKDIPENVNFTFIADCCHSGNIQKAARGIEFYPRFLYQPADVEARIAALRKKRDTDRQGYQAAQLAQMLPELMAQFSGEQLQAAINELLAHAEQQFIQNNYYGVVRFQRHVLLAACESTQTAADARIEDDWRGAFTWGLSKAIVEANGKLTYGQLIKRAGANIKDYDQRPQLECPDEMKNLKFLAPLA